jgi:hypothetical protein
MSRSAWLGALVALMFAAAAPRTSGGATPPDKTPHSKTATRTGGTTRALTTEDTELARYFDLLLDLDLLERLDLMKMMPLLEDGSGR